MSAVSGEWKLSAIKQRFTLPEALVFYMAKNPPSPEVFHILIRCCKYFWLKNPVITFKDFSCSTYHKYWRTIKINGFGKYQEFHIENLNEKLWICWHFSVWGDRNQFMASSFIPRIHRCDLNSLMLFNQIVSFDEFQKFISSGSLELLKFYKTIVKNKDGTIVPIEKLIELLPNVKIIYYENVNTEDGGLQTITSETAANLIAILHFHQIKNVTMHKIPESFNIEAFFAAPKVSTSVFN